VAIKTLKDVGEDPRSAFRECRPLRKFLNYMDLMRRIIDVDPSNSEETKYQ